MEPQRTPARTIRLSTVLMQSAAASATTPCSTALDHDVVHCWFGEVVRNGPSPVLHAVAHGLDATGELADLEEEIVKSLQRYFNLGGWPEMLLRSTETQERD